MSQKRDEMRPAGGNGHGEPVRGSRLMAPPSMPTGSMTTGSMTSMEGARSQPAREGEMPAGAMQPMDAQGAGSMNAYGGAGGMPSGSMVGTSDAGQRQAQGGAGPGGMPAAAPGKGVSLGADRGITLSGTWKVSFTLDSDT